MDDDFPKETPRFWIAFSILCIAFALSFVMAVFTSIRAEAQQMLCPPTEPLLKQLAEVHKERPVWGGVTPNGNMETILFQSPEGGWTFILIRPDGHSCILAAGKDAAPPIESLPGKGV